MRAARTYRWVLGLLSALILMAHPAWGQRIAVFPLEDLSRGPNGVSFQYTKDLVRSLQKKHREVVSEQAVFSFMARHRIRNVGYLDTQSILAARNELGVDLILVGSVSHRTRQGLPPALALTLNLIRSEDTRTVWARTVSLGSEDVQRLLGIAEPQTEQDLVPLVMDQVLSSFPRQVEIPDNQQPIYSIEEASLHPRYVKPGETVTCSVLVRAVTPRLRQKPKIYVKEGNRLHLAKEAPDSHRLLVRWTGDPGQPGRVDDDASRRIQLAMAHPTSMLYEAFLVGSQDGRFPVTLILTWPNGAKKVAFLGTYYVDGTPPAVDLESRGVMVDGQAAFRDRIVLIPRMKNREPITRWRIRVIDHRGEELVSEQGEGWLPRNFIWNGKTGEGIYAEEGSYQVELELWDRAGNTFTTTKKILFARTPPMLSLAAFKEGNRLELTVDRQSLPQARAMQPLPISYWRLELRLANGALLLRKEGKSLPATVETAPEAQPLIGPVEGVVEVRDILGNRRLTKIANLEQLAAQQARRTKGKKTSKESDPDSQWVEEF